MAIFTYIENVTPCINLIIYIYIFFFYIDEDNQVSLYSLNIYKKNIYIKMTFLGPFIKSLATYFGLIKRFMGQNQLLNF